MANLVSNNEEQSPLNCQICEVESSIKYKCMDCKMLMCENCKEKIHPKFLRGKEHMVLNIKDIELQTEASNDSIDFDSIKCDKHSDQVCCLYCTDCDQVICARCIPSAHKKHDFMEINEGYQLQKEQLKDATLKLEKEKENMANEIGKLEKMKMTEQEKYNQVSQDILTQEKSLYEGVNNCAKEIKEDLDKKWKLVQESIQNEITHINQEKEKIGVKININEVTMNIRDSTKFFQTTKELEKSQENEREKRSILTIPRFIPKVIREFNIGELESNTKETHLHENNTIEIEESESGIAEGKAEQSDSSCFKDEISEKETNTTVNRLGELKKYSLNSPLVYQLCQYMDEIIWTYAHNDDSGELKKSEIPESFSCFLNHIANYNIKVYGMVMTISNDLLLCLNAPRLKLINGRTGKIKNTQYTIEPLVPHCICTSYNKTLVYVGAINDDFPRHGRRVIIKMNKNGRHLSTFENNEKEEPLFTFPLALACSNANELFVVDGIDDCKGYRVVIFDNDKEKYKHGYYGHPEINTTFNRQFCPWEIKTATSGKIVVLDTGSQTMHIINSSAELITHIDLEKLGIPAACSFGCSSKFLYIGCDGKEKDEDDEEGNTEVAGQLYTLNIQSFTPLTD